MSPCVRLRLCQPCVCVCINFLIGLHVAIENANAQRGPHLNGDDFVKVCRSWLVWTLTLRWEIWVGGWVENFEIRNSFTGFWQLLVRSGQNHLSRRNERGRKTKPPKEEVRRQQRRMDTPGVWQVPEGGGENKNWIKLVAQSSVVPEWPLRLKDWWWWWCQYELFVLIVMGPV